MKLNEGDYLLDNDPRTGGTRVLQIVEPTICDDYVTAWNPKLKRKVNIKRSSIHLDDKVMKTGFSLCNAEGHRCVFSRFGS